MFPVLQHLREAGVDIQRVVRSDAVRDLLQAVAQAGIGVDNTGGTFCDANQFVSRVVFVHRLAIRQHIPIIVPLHGLSVDGRQPVGGIIGVGGLAFDGGFRQAVAHGVIGVVVVVTGTVIGGCQAGEAVIRVVDGHRVAAGVAAGQCDYGIGAARQGTGIFGAAPELSAVEVTAEAVGTLRQGEGHLAILAGCTGVAFVRGAVKRVDLHAFERGMVNAFNAQGHGDGDGHVNGISIYEKWS